MAALAKREISQNEKLTIDSREVAKMIGKRHDHLLRDIERYIGYISESPRLGSQDFFIESSYKSEGNNKTYKCYQVTKKGCEFIANKLTGQKGTQFTATYINRFHEMEERLSKPQSELDVLRQAIDQIEMAQREAREAKQIATSTSKNMEQINNIVNVEDQTTLRQQFNQSVKALAYDKSWPVSDTYNKIYKIINNNKHINLKLRARNADKRPIDILERDNLLEYALRVVNHHFN
ncbi:MAG: Rha family transcriptional regulator [Halanaerobiales bacterium]|nr:Rha family transcriptional regulator [Halanaerobiales bacterium]